MMLSYFLTVFVHPASGICAAVGSTVFAHGVCNVCTWEAQSLQMGFAKLADGKCNDATWLRANLILLH